MPAVSWRCQGSVHMGPEDAEEWNQPQRYLLSYESSLVLLPYALALSGAGILSQLSQVTQYDYSSIFLRKPKKHWLFQCKSNVPFNFPKVENTEMLRNSSCNSLPQHEGMHSCFQQTDPHFSNRLSCCLP